MRALLVLCLIAATDAAVPGFGLSEGSALKLYAWYTGFVYFTPLLGGWLADNYIGQRRAVIIGGLVMAAGQFTLAAGIGGLDMTVFAVGLVLLVVGNGFFKANISTMVGELYHEGDKRRDGAFTIFYMGVNVGAFIAPLVCSTLGENPQLGWKYGFIAAGVGMLISVVVQLLFAQKYLGDVGKRPSAERALELAGGSHKALTGEERDRLRVILVLFIFVVLFWAAFEQAGGLMNIWAERSTNRMVGAFEVPAGWFQSLNPIFIIALAPLFAMFWTWLANRGSNPPAPKKMILGLFLTAAGFGFMVMAVLQAHSAADGKASMTWLALAYLFHTMGELCISPVGLSLMTKLAPLRFASLIMGVWFLINFVANIIAGYVGAYAEKQGEYAIFGGIVVVLVVFASILWLLSGRLVDWMHGAETIIERPIRPVIVTEP
jgi:POT family proton-dependent oligopeptide transporter